jgi:muramoyltetrapeptide carboxypeptidase
VAFTNIIKPQKLNPGDTIGIVSPASPVYGEKLERFEKGVRYLQNRGYTIKIGQFARRSFGYLAGTDDERLDDLMSMFADTNVKAIFTTRGGFGSIRLLDKIDYDIIRNNPKILMGYSDITALQLAILAKSNLVSFSGPMVAPEFGVDLDPITEKYCWSVLEYSKEIAFESSELKTNILKTGIAQGPLLGGTLSIICSLLGTSYLPSFQNAILVLEDIGEDEYKIDRYFSQLKLAGIFNQISGLVLGNFTNCKSNPNSETPTRSLDDIIRDFISEMNMPVLGNFNFGHERKKFTLPIGIQAELNCEQGVLRLLEPGVTNE